MDDGIGLAIADLPTTQVKKPSPPKGGVSIAALANVKPKESPKGLSSPLGQFVDRSVEAVKTAAVQLPKDLPEAAKWINPMTSPGMMALGQMGLGMAETAVAGVAALAKSIVTPVVRPASNLSPQEQAQQNFDQSLTSFTNNYNQIKGAIDKINLAPETDAEKAMGGLLNILPDGANAVGDTVYDKTGSALAATGAIVLTLSLSPVVAGKVLGKVTEAGSGTKAPSRVSAAFDELAAKDPQTADHIANHLDQIDKKTAQYLRRRIQKFIDASEEDLNYIAQRASDAAIAEMSGNIDDIIKGNAGQGEGRNLGTRYGSNQPIAREGNKPPTDVKRTMQQSEEANRAYIEAARQDTIQRQRQMRTTDVPPPKGGGAPTGGGGAPPVISVPKAEATLRTTVKDALAELENNASGESAASVEAINRVGQEKEASQQRYILHDDDTVTPLTGVDAVDYKAKSGEVVVQHGIGDKPFSILDRGGLTKGIAEGRVNRAVGLGNLKRPGGKQQGPIKGDPDTVYFNMGVPVSRAQVEAAFRLGGELLMRAPGVTIAREKMTGLYTHYIDLFNPEAKGAPARTAGAAIASNFFEQAHRELVTWEKGKDRRVYWQKMGESASMDFIDGFETGKQFNNPLWESARVGYKAWAERIYAQDMKTGFTYNPIDHYMPHLFEDQAGVIEFFQKKYGNRWSDPGFIKARGFDLYKEARDAGYTPKYTNPEEIMQARQQASDIAALRTDLLADLERKGVARIAEKGATKAPDGFSPNSRRSPTGVRYWIREEADQLMYNAFDSKSLWDDTGAKGLRKLAGPPFRGYMELKNKLIPIKLAASLFHPMHVMHIDAAAELTRATLPMLISPSIGKVKNFMLSIATSAPFTPGALYRSLWDNPKTGYPLLRVFQGKRDFATLSDSEKAAYSDLAEGGLVPTRPMEETSSSIQNLKDAWNQKSAGAVWHLPWAVMQSLTTPIYSVWIPSLKIASYLKDAKVAREANPNWTPSQRQEAFRQIARKVESRYGEMNYKSMFMDKMVKDIGVAINLSFGWNVGLLDQYVGGAIDLGRTVGGKGSFKEKVKYGLMDRPVFAAYYVGSALIVGGLMHKWFTGQDPKDLIDYTHPKSGEKDQYGKDIRLNTMFYTREFEGLYKHMEQEGVVPGLTDFVVNKGSGLMEMGRSAVTGIDGLGQEIRDPNAPAYKQFEQTLLSEFGGLEPISVEAIQKSTGSKVKMGGLSVLGFTPAGKYISETVTEGKIAADYNKYVRPKEKPFQAVEMSKDVKTLRQMYNTDDSKYDAQLDKMVTKYDMDSKDIHHLEKLFRSPKEQEFDPSIYMFSHLPWEAQKPLLDKMTPEERDNYLPHISKAKRHKYERETEQ